MSRDQAGTLYSGHHSADVQDTGAERADTRLQSVGAVSGRNQVQRRASDSTRRPAGGVFPLYLAIETPEKSVAAETAAEYLQFVHNRDRVAAIRRTLRLPRLSGEGGHYPVAEVSRAN